MIPKRDKTTDISTEIAQGKMFRKRLMKAVDDITNRFVNDASDLNQLVAEVAKKESFNQIQIQRLVEETNTIAYNKRYNQVKKGSDRRFTFDLAELSRVLDIMGPDAPEKIDNPNWVKGKVGEGNMDKKASAIESSYIHNPNSKIAEKRERLMEKKASTEQKQMKRELDRLEKEISSDIFKVASSFVSTEKLYKKANETFNTVLSEVELDEDIVSGIQKKASEISQHLSKTGRAFSNFVVSLEVNPTEKVASTVLGEYSLVKKANETTFVEQPKVAPTVDIAQYQQLIDVVKDIQRKQTRAAELQNTLNPENGVGLQ